MNTKSILSFAAIAFALALAVGPFSAVSVIAEEEDNGDDFEQSIRQSIEQSQESDQESTVVSDFAIASGNNFNSQEQDNEGDNVAVQDSE